MTGGRKPVAAVDESKGFSEWMAYRWIDNPHLDTWLSFRLFEPHKLRLHEWYDSGNLFAEGRQ